MSKMSDLVLDIEYLQNKGMSFAQIARELEIPVSFVIEAQEIIKSNQDSDEECSPFATINS